MVAFGKRSVLTWMIIFILVLSLSGGVFTIYIMSRATSYAEMVNRLGIIRGSIERVVKLEFAGVENKEQIRKIDIAFNEFINNKLPVDENNRISASIDRLFQSWSDLREELEQFNLDETVEKKETLLKKSEVAWTKANEMVLTSQIVSEEKNKGYRSIYVFSVINLLLGMFIIILLQKYIRKSLEKLAHYDGLTNLYNRRFFNETLSNTIAKSTRYNTSFALILFDLDYFKQINDTEGHDMGDTVLKHLAELLKKRIRKSDVIARIGGDEFAIIAEETKINEAFELSEKLRKSVETENFPATSKLTISIGVAEYKTDDDLNTLFKRADKALYKAKKMGRNRCEKEMPA
jgi:diguanylate cyclase (GGDEF)-like protein